MIYFMLFAPRGEERRRQQMSNFKEPEERNPAASFEKSKKSGLTDKIDEKRQVFRARRKQAIPTLTGPRHCH
jgi:hypothetical protein